MCDVIMATNRPDVLDAALLRPGRLDRKVEIPLPNEMGRVEILKIHALPITKYGEISYENLAKLSEGFNGADLRNICTEAGMFAIRSERDYVIEVSMGLLRLVQLFCFCPTLSAGGLFESCAQDCRQQET